MSPEETVPLALDWMNGRRTPDANQRLTGAITGIRLGTDAPRIFRSLVEATAFGSRAIVERFRAQGIRIDSAIAIGGVAKKSRFVMQTIADVMNLEVTVAAGDQTVALGAAMFAATAAGLYAEVEDAQRAMSSGTESVYQPDPGPREAIRPSLQGLLWRSARSWRASSARDRERNEEQANNEREKHAGSLVLDRQPGALRSGDAEPGRRALPARSRRISTPRCRCAWCGSPRSRGRTRSRRCAWKPTRHPPASA